MANDINEALTSEFKTANPLTILLLCGGPSAEREVSLASGQTVADALKDAGHHVTVSDIDPEDMSVLDDSSFDLVFPVLHGTFGEDGKLQEVMEEKGLKFVGSGSTSSALAMNKHAARKSFKHNGLNVALGGKIRKGLVELDAVTQVNNKIEEILSLVGFPCVIKPNEQGSSFGVIIAANDEQADEAIWDNLTRYGDCLIEQFVEGREFTVGIIGEKVLPVLEVKPKEGFYDYNAKYVSDETEYIFDFELAADKVVQMQDAALKAFNVLGCRDIARVDLILDNDGRIVVLEVNTLPGFTSHSLVPKAAMKTGLTMPQLCDLIVQNAYTRPI